MALPVPLTYGSGAYDAMARSILSASDAERAALFSADRPQAPKGPWEGRAFNMPGPGLDASVRGLEGRQFLKIIESSLTLTDRVVTRVLLPLRPMPEDGMVKVRRIHAHRTALVPLPVLGVPPTMRSSYSEFTKSADTWGIGYQSEGKFLETPIGSLYYMSAIRRVVTATYEHMEIKGMHEILNNEHQKAWLESDYVKAKDRLRVTLRSDTFEGMCQNVFEDWNMIHRRSPGAFVELVQSVREHMESMGVSPDVLLIPSGMAGKVRLRPDALRVDGFTDGQSVLKKLGMITTESGMVVMTGPKMRMNNSPNYTDMLVQDRTVGEFHPMRHEDVCKNVPRSQYRSWMRSIRIYDHALDVMKPVALSDVYKYSGLYNQNGAITAIGRALFSEQQGPPVRTMRNYLSRLPGNWIRAFTAADNAVSTGAQRGGDYDDGGDDDDMATGGYLNDIGNGVNDPGLTDSAKKIEALSPGLWRGVAQLTQAGLFQPRVLGALAAFAAMKVEDRRKRPLARFTFWLLENANDNAAVQQIAPLINAANSEVTRALADDKSDEKSVLAEVSLIARRTPDELLAFSPEPVWMQRIQSMDQIAGVNGLAVGGGAAAAAPAAAAAAAAAAAPAGAAAPPMRAAGAAAAAPPVPPAVPAAPAAPGFPRARAGPANAGAAVDAAALARRRAAARAAGANIDINNFNTWADLPIEECDTVFKQLIANNRFFPIDFVLAREIVHKMASITAMVAGSATGETYAGASNTSKGFDAQSRFYTWRFTLDSLAVLYNPNNIMHRKNVACYGHSRGGHVRFFDPNNGAHTGMRQRPDGERVHGGITVYPMRPGDALGTMIDICGVHSPELIAYIGRDSAMANYPLIRTAQAVAARWHLRPGTALFDIEYGDMRGANQKRTTLAFRAPTYFANTRMEGEFAKIGRGGGKGHWGAEAWDGIGRLRLGKDGGVPSLFAGDQILSGTLNNMVA